MQPLISVIVPVYKVEPYLDQCVNSIVNQTYTNLEIILVDDGSPDNCPQMCDDWAKKDSRIKVIHKENGGLSDARNAGLAIASGEYIGFVDSDDWISEDMYHLLYDNMLDNDSDISACGVEMFYENSTPSKALTISATACLNTNQALLASINEDYIKHPVVYKLYKHDTIKGIEFPFKKCHEDVFWTYQALGKASKVYIFPKICYYYRQRSDGIMGSSYSLKRLDSLEAKLDRCNYFLSLDSKLASIAQLNLWFSCIYSMQMSKRYLNKNDFKIAKSIIYEYKTKCRKPQIKTARSFKTKCWLIMSFLSFYGTCLIRNFLKIGF